MAGLSRITPMSSKAEVGGQRVQIREHCKDRDRTAARAAQPRRARFRDAVAARDGGRGSASTRSRCDGARKRRTSVTCCVRQSQSRLRDMADVGRKRSSSDGCTGTRLSTDAGGAAHEVERGADRRRAGQAHAPAGAVARRRATGDALERGERFGVDAAHGELVDAAAACRRATRSPRAAARA